jgi:hypothetical protein
VWWNSSSGQVYVMLLNGATIKSHGLLWTEPDTQWRIVGSGDFTGSGVGNQLIWHHLGRGEVYRMTVTTSPFGFTATGTSFYREPNTQWRIVAAADFNGDARQDLLWRNTATGQVYVMLLADTLVLGGAVIHTEPNPAWQVVALGDYDANGRKDILWRNEATGMLYLMLINELTILQQGVIYNEPRLDWRVLGPREFSR